MQKIARAQIGRGEPTCPPRGSRSPPHQSSFSEISFQRRGTRRLITFFTVSLLFAAFAAHAAPGKYALSTAHPLATEAGAGILDTGGNAFDAAITVAATLAVVEPYSSGIGGGGFWLLHRAEDGMEVMLDGRERAPFAAHRDMFLDKDRNVVPKLSVDGALAAGIPGLPAALVYLARHYGRLPLAKTLAPAIRIATQGFTADAKFIRLLRLRLDAVRASAASAEIFLVNGELPKPGHLIRQPDLAEVLRQIAVEGKDGFYRGEIGRKLVAGVVAAGGIWQRKDLTEYELAVREPVRFSYRGAHITGAAPPSSGGIVMAQIMNIVSQFNLGAMTRIEKTHYLAEAMRFAYRDRARHLGDPDFVQMPTARLTSARYAAQLAHGIGKTRTPTAGDRSGETSEGGNTTHYSIIDAAGNRVAATLSLNYAFGSGLTVPATGVLLNNEMDDFVAKPGTPNLYGLVGGKANSIEPGKRMLSSMSPTFIDDGRRIAILGTPGGSRIITMVTLATLALLDGADAKAVVGAKRFHHQYLPDSVQFEPQTFSAGEQKRLTAMGHRLKPLEKDYGNMQIVIWDYKNNTLDAAADPRGIGATRIE